MCLVMLVAILVGMLVACLLLLHLVAVVMTNHSLLVVHVMVLMSILLVGPHGFDLYSLSHTAQNDTHNSPPVKADFNLATSSHVPWMTAVLRRVLSVLLDRGSNNALSPHSLDLAGGTPHPSHSTGFDLQSLAKR